MSLFVGIIAVFVLFIAAVVLCLTLVPMAVGLLFPLVLLALIAFAFVFWIWMLVDCIRNENISGTERVIWALVIFFTHCLGALIYFFVGRSRSPRASFVR
ncbi:MAG TPA: PLDc N-terminal domain-containing protein [Verrucomicrobiae bacterium]|jgi:hypothetical protein|nr:PLDc N-terminal domain-containing protein [Verrucomicrobiae bacterium]